MTDDRLKLSFHKSDIIRLQVMNGLERGEMLLYESTLAEKIDIRRLIDTVSCRLQLWLCGEEEGCVSGRG